MEPKEYTYPCVTKCHYKGQIWEPGDVFATTDPADLPPHHFEGGVNPKDKKAVRALLAERGIKMPTAEAAGKPATAPKNADADGDDLDEDGDDNNGEGELEDSGDGDAPESGDVAPAKPRGGRKPKNK